MMSNKRSAIIIPCIANCIEIYDFTLFPILLPILSHFIFPTEGSISASEIGYLAFAISFLIVPFSAIFWGYYGDKYGKNSLLKYSLLLMATPSLIIALTPSYTSIGIAAAMIVVFARIVQGISASAEVLGSKIYAINSLDNKYHLLASSLISASGAIGVTAALMMGYTASHLGYSWRYAFMVGASLFIVVMFIKSRKAKDDSHRKKNITLSSIIGVLKVHKRQAIYTFTLSSVLGLLSYSLHSFMISYAIEKLGNAADGYLILAKALLVTAATAATYGVSSLYFKINSKAAIRILLILLTLVVTPCFMLIRDASMIQYTTIVMSFLLGFYAATSGVLVITAFPLESRFRGALLVNAFGVAIFGGTAPFILKVLSGYSITYAGLYLMSMFSIALLVVLKHDYN